MRSPLLQILWPGWRRYRFDLFGALLTAFVAQIVGVAMPLVARAFMKDHATVAAQTSSLAMVIAILAGLALLRIVATWQQVFRGERLAQRMLRDLRSDLYAHLQTLSYGYFERRPLGKLLIRFVGDANALRAWIAKTAISIPTDVIVIVLILGLVGFISPITLAAALVPLVIVLPVMWLLNPRIQRETRFGRRALALLSGRLDTNLANIAAIKVNQRYAAAQGEIDHGLHDVAAAGIRRGRLEAVVQAAGQGGASLSLAAVLATGMWLLSSGALVAGDVIALIWLVILLRGPVTRLTRANTAYQKALVSAERIQKLMQRVPEPGRGGRVLPAKPLPIHLAFKNVGYRDSRGQWLLRAFDADFRGPGLCTLEGLDAQAGRVVLELVLRLRRPHEGRLKLNGRSMRRYDVDAWRSRCSWIRSMADFETQGDRLDEALVWLVDVPAQDLADRHLEPFIDSILYAAQTKLILVNGAPAALLDRVGEVLTTDSTESRLISPKLTPEAAIS